MTFKNNPEMLKIMVVDDEPMVLEVSCLMLESLGHDVTPYSNPQAALADFKEHHQRYDLVVIDMMMPQMSGRELFNKLHQIHSEIMVIMASGYQLNESNRELLEIGVKGFIEKPFSISSLNKTLQEIFPD